VGGVRIHFGLLEVRPEDIDIGHDKVVDERQRAAKQHSPSRGPGWNPKGALALELTLNK